jgi:hypothetical protein
LVSERTARTRMAMMRALLRAAGAVVDGLFGLFGYKRMFKCKENL